MNRIVPKANCIYQRLLEQLTTRKWQNSWCNEVWLENILTPQNNRIRPLRISLSWYDWIMSPNIPFPWYNWIKLWNNFFYDVVKLNLEVIEFSHKAMESIVKHPYFIIKSNMIIKNLNFIIRSNLDHQTPLNYNEKIVSQYLLFIMQ